MDWLDEAQVYTILEICGINLKDNEKQCGNNPVQYRRAISRDRKTSYTFYLLISIYFN